MMPDQRYRVGQGATGNLGTRALRSSIEHPHLDLVGVRVYADDKVGRDAGEFESAVLRRSDGAAHHDA